MPFTHQITANWQRGNDQFSKSLTREADGEKNIDVAVADGANNFAIAFALDISELKSLVIVSDKDLTLETNSGSSPVDTFALKANEPLLWWEDCPLPNPFTDDITGLFATNASGGVATLSIRAAVNV